MAWYDAHARELEAAGIPRESAEDFIARNPQDFHRIVEALTPDYDDYPGSEEAPAGWQDWGIDATHPNVQLALSLGMPLGVIQDFLRRNPNDEPRLISALDENAADLGLQWPVGQPSPGGGAGGGGMGPAGDVGSVVDRIGSAQGGTSRFGLSAVPSPTLPTWQAPPPFAFDAYPAAQPFSYPDWQAPSVDQVLADPSYQWRKGQGEESLQRWAAARGTLNASDTATGLIDYGQKAASQEYANVWNRAYAGYGANRATAFDTANLNEANRFNAYQTNRAGALDQYTTNYGTQYADPFRVEYQRQQDLFAPQMAEWMTEADLTKQAAGITGQQTLLAQDLAGRGDLQTQALASQRDLQTQALGSARDLQTQSLTMTDAWNRYLAQLEQRRWEDEFNWRVTSED